MSSFAVHYRSRGEVRELRWADGTLTAEPLVETLVAALIRRQQVVRSAPAEPGVVATLDDPEPAALTILEALYEVGAHIVDWEGDIGG